MNLSLNLKCIILLTVRIRSFLLLAFIFFFSSTNGQNLKVKNAFESVLKLFEHHQIVAIGELHCNNEIWEFINKLIELQGFASKINTIIFEGGNSMYQQLMDDYILGDDIDETEIKIIWRNNTQINTTFDAPIYLNFLRHVRKVNFSLPKEQKIRVILLDPPIDWNLIRTEQDYLPYLMERESHMYQTVINEVYSKNKTCLFIAGSGHVFKSKDESKSKPLNALSTLGKKFPGSTFSIKLHDGDGLSVSLLDSTEQLFEQFNKPAFIESSELNRIHPEFKKTSENFDALIYLGKRGNLTSSSPSLGVCTGNAEDENWKNLIILRQSLVNSPPFIRTDIEQICTPLPKQYFDQNILKKNVLKRKN